jgi:hypothetical protein
MLAHESMGLPPMRVSCMAISASHGHLCSPLPLLAILHLRPRVLVSVLDNLELPGVHRDSPPQEQHAWPDILALAALKEGPAILDVHLHIAEACIARLVSQSLRAELWRGDICESLPRTISTSWVSL